MTTLALTTVDLARMQFATTSIFLTHRRAGLTSSTFRFVLAALLREELAEGDSVRHGAGV